MRSVILIVFVLLVASSYELEPIPQRVSALLSKMTLQEKIQQLYHRSAGIKPDFTGGIGYVAAGWSSHNKDAKTYLDNRNQLQSRIINGSRLKIPAGFSLEGMHSGVWGGTVFPELISMGATWNTTLVQKMYEIVALEGKAVGVNILYAPVINMWTDPRFGREQEGFSENPTISAHMGAAAAVGLQGVSKSATDYLPKNKAVSLAKHYVAYGAALGGLNAAPADISDRTLFEVYVKPWRAWAKAGGRAFMASHNTVNDIPMHANAHMINGVLRKELGMDGMGLSDCNDIGVIYNYRYAANRTQAAAFGLKAGVDMDLQCGGKEEEWSYNKLEAALSEGLITMQDIDTAVTNVLNSKFASGAFDTPFADPANLKVLNTAAHRQVAFEAAAQSVVLMVNKNNALPTPVSGKKVALIGQNAAYWTGSSVNDKAAENLLGSYYMWDKKVNVSTVDIALREAGADVSWAQGCIANGPPDSGANMIPEAVQLAKASDMAILVLGDVDGGCGEWVDRDDLDLNGGQLQLLEAVVAVAKKTIVVLINGRQQTFGVGNKVLDQVDGVLGGFRPGEEGGRAIVSIITGQVNPSGKLAQSWPRTVGQVHSGSSPWLQRVRGKWIANNRKPIDPTGRHYDSYVSDGWKDLPLFYFGFGLSYTTFAYSNLVVQSVNKNEVQWNVSFELQNTGSREGTEVTQIYVSDPAGLGFVPFWRRLIGFQRVGLAAGERKTVVVPILKDDVAMYDANMKFGILAGAYTVFVGPDSGHALLSQSIVVSN